MVSCAAHEDLQRRPAGGEYIAERPYAAMFKDELSFPKEAVLYILEKSFDGWCWLGLCDGGVMIM